MIDNAGSQLDDVAAVRDGRLDPRIAGPFDGWRVGALDTPLRIFDLSRGGCFVNSMHEQAPGTQLTMKIVLPQIGMLTLRGETLYERSGFGFAVRFVDVDTETTTRLAHALEILQRETSSSWQRSPRAPAPVVLGLPDALAQSHANRYFLETRAPRRAPETRPVERPRAGRVGMLGSGYRVLVDGQHVGLINLSLTGVQIRGPVQLVLARPAIVKIGWPQDKLSLTAMARVRWVQPEPDPSESELIYRAGLAFETWDVRHLKQIMGSRSRSSVPVAEVVGTW